MRFALTLLAVSLPFMTACTKKSGGGGSDATAKLTGFRDQVCACKDKACAEQVTAEMTRWKSEHKGEVGRVSRDEQKKMAVVLEEIGTCVTTLRRDDAAADAGSAAAMESGAAPGSGMAAGSGNDTGSAAMGAGAGSGTGMAGDAMAHRAGMCPSTVFGATTKSAMKGKAVIVTIEAADKDAIAAIQKRTDELLAEKKDAPTGSGHDMKGSHGGGQGLCPVYVPEGAKAIAQHQAKGVVVTVTPKDKLADLAKEIDGRVAKAADWVKTNVKEGDKGNQGGVGGGTGDDGSNHSGKGDGKGQERKKGGGGGKGTGGGGGTGDGGGGSKRG